MAFKTTFADEAERDLDLIFAHLFESHIGFGEDHATAIDRAQQRTQGIREDAYKIAKAPFRGTRRPDLGGARHITRNRAIIWFEVKETTEEVHVLGIFFGGQDHYRHMLARLLRDS